MHLQTERLGALEKAAVRALSDVIDAEYPKQHPPQPATDIGQRTPPPVLRFTFKHGLHFEPASSIAQPLPPPPPSHIAGTAAAEPPTPVPPPAPLELGVPNTPPEASDTAVLAAPSYDDSQGCNGSVCS